MPNRSIPCPPARWWAMLLVAGFLGVVTAPPSHAQDAPAEAESSTPPVVIDMQKLLSDQQVFVGSVADDVLALEAPGNAQFIMIPVNPQAVSQDTPIDQFTVKLAAGRFIAWYLPPVEGKSIEPRKGVRFTGANDIAVELNISPPRLTKKVVLTADGKIQWSLPRAMMHSTYRGTDNAYVLKANRTALRPPVQPRISRGANEAPAAFQTRRRAELQKYYDDRTRYAIIRKAINELPDDFEEPAPPTLWAVFEASQLLRDVKLSGPAPLPWAMQIDQFRQLRRMIMAPPAKLRILSEVAPALVADGHPMSQRAAALAISSGDTPKTIPADHPLVDTIRSLLANGDRETRMSIAFGFARHAGDAPAAGPVLLAAAADPDPAVTFGALRARVATAGPEPDPQLTAKVAESVTRMLPMAEAPPIEDMVGIVLALARKQPATTTTLADGIDLAKVHADRRDALVLRVLQLAIADNPVAVYWLDKQLLGGTNPQLRNVTLARIVELDASMHKPDPETGKQSAERIYRLSSADHAIVKLIAGDDAKVRAAAWGAIGAFRILPPPNAKPESEAGSEAGSETDEFDVAPLYAAVTDVALKQDPTPSAALTFLSKQRHATKANDQITRLLLEGGGPVRTGALRRLASLGNEAFRARFEAMGVGDRIETALLWYDADPRPEPAVTSDDIATLMPLLSLTAEEDAPAEIVGWFARQIVAGRRPVPRQWASAMGSTEAMLAPLLMGDADQRRAAAAALASQTGWPTDNQIAEVIRIAENAANEEPDPALRAPKLSGMWAAGRIKLSDQWFGSVGGTYLVRMVIDQPRPKDAGPLDPTPEPKIIEIGRLALAASPTPDKPGEMTVTVDPEAIKIAASSDPIGMSIQDAAAVNALAGDKADTKTTLAAGKIDLIPGAGGTWTGSAKLALGGAVQIELVPQK